VTRSSAFKALPGATLSWTKAGRFCQVEEV
jgi:hypothetical protein